MRRRTDATFRVGQIVSRAKAIQAEAHPNSWPYCMYWALREREESDGKYAAYWVELRNQIVAALREHDEKFKYVFDDIPFPAEVASYLAKALDDLSQGETHPLFTRRILPGGRGNVRSRQRQQCVDAGVDYLIAVDLDLIADERSRSTVAEAFGVTPKQVQRWLAARGKEARRRTEFAERWRQKLAHDRDPARTTARMVRKLMRSHGDEFRSLREK